MLLKKIILIIFSYLPFRKYIGYICHEDNLDFFLISSTVQTASGYLGWDATLTY